MSDELGRGIIVVQVEQNVEREMQKAQRDMQRELRNISRDKATVTLDANLKPLQKKVDEAEKKLDEWRAKKAEAKLDVDTRKAEKKLDEWEAKLKERRTARDEVKLDTKQAQAGLLKLQKLEERADAAREKQADRAIKGQQKVTAAYAKESAAREAADQRAFDKASKLSLRAADQRAKEIEKEAELRRKDDEAERKGALATAHYLANLDNAAFDARQKAYDAKSKADFVANSKERELGVAQAHYLAKLEDEAHNRRKALATKERADFEKAADKEQAAQLAHAHFLANLDNQSFDTRRKLRDAAVKADMDATRAEATADNAAWDARAKSAAAASKAHMDAVRAEAAADNHSFDVRRKQAEADAAHEEKLRRTTVDNWIKAGAEREKADQKISDNVSKIRLADIAAQKRAAQADRTLGRLGSTPTERITAKVEKAHALEEMAALRAQLDAIGAKPINIPVHMDEHGSEALAKWASALTDTTVRLGPFTTTIAGAARGLALLGPIIIGVIGTVGALAAALGAGLLGALGVTSAAIGGFGLAAIGAIGVLKPMIGEVKNAMAASKAYAKAVREHGKGSEEAAKKQKILTNVLRDTDDRTKAAFLSAGGLEQKWKTLTAPSRAAAFHAVGEGIRTWGALMPQVATRTNDMFKVLDKGISGWAKGLRGVEASGIIDNIMGNFNAALPSVLAGLGNLATWAGRWMSAFSDFLPALTGGFEAWSKGLADGAKNAGVLQGKAAKLVNAMQSIGHLGASAGRVLSKFFGAGVAPGVGLIDRMTKGLDKMAASMDTNSVGNGFKDAIGTTEKLYGVLQPLISLFIEWSTVMRPITDVGLQMAHALLSVVQVLANFGPSRDILRSVFAIFIAGTLVAKIASAVGALKSLAMGVREVGAASATMKGLNALTGGVGPAVGSLRGQERQMERTTAATIAGSTAFAGWGGAAERAAPKVEKAAASGGKFARAAKAGGTGAFNLISGLTGLGPGGLVAVGGLVMVGAAVYELTKKHNETVKAIGRSRAAYGQYKATLAGLPSLQMQTAQAVIDTSTAQASLSSITHQVNKAQKEGKDHGQAYKQLLMQQTQATLDYARSKQTIIDASKQEQKNSDARLKSLKAEQKAAVQAVASSALEGPAAQKKAMDQLATAQSHMTAAQNADILASLNHQRALKAMIPIAASAASEFGKLNKLGGKALSVKISTKFADPDQAAAVAAKANKALQSGIKSDRVLNVVANSKDAEQAIRRLNQIRLSDKNLNIIEKGGDAAVRKVEEIAGKKISAKDAKIISRGGPAAIDMLNKIIGTAVPDHHFRVLANDAATAIINGIKKNTIPGKLFNIHANAGQAISAANSVVAALRAITSKTVTVTTNHVNRGHGTKGGFSGGYFPAADGTSAAERTQQRAYDRAQARNSQQTRGGEYTAPTLLVGEESKPEYVIATNPAYRERNVNFLGQAASDFGYTLVEAASKGKAPAPKKAPAKAAPGAKPKHDYTVPPKYAALGVPLDQVQNEVDAAKGPWDSNRDARASNRKALHSAEDKVTKYEAKLKEKHLTKAARKTANQNLTDAKKEQDKQKRTEKRLSAKWPAIDNRYRDAQARYKAASAIDKQITSYNGKIDDQRKLMDQAATAKDPTKFDAAKKERGRLLGLLQPILANAKKYATAGSAWADTLDSDLIDIGGTIQDNEQVYPADDPVTLSLDDIIAQYGSAPYLSAILKDISTAKLNNNTPDNATTSQREDLDALSDDVTAQDTLANFYSSVLGRAKADGLSDDLVTEATDRFVSARDEAAATRASMNPAAADTPDAADDGTSAALLTQAQTATNVAQSNADINAAFIRTGMGPGSLGSGGLNAIGALFGSNPGGPLLGAFSAPAANRASQSAFAPASAAGGRSDAPASSVTHIEVNTLHPGDPKTLRAIGDAATAGQSSQSYVGSSRRPSNY